MLAHLRIAVLGAWAGSMISYALLAVPAAFAHLPTHLAAEVLGEGFNGLDRVGITSGLLCSILGVGCIDRGRALEWLRAWAPLLAVAGHALSYAWVTPEIAEIRRAAGGAISQIPAGDPSAARFEQLHELSRALYTFNGLVPLCTCVWDLFASRENANGAV